MLQEYLKKYFALTSFRPGQEEVIASILEGHDTLAIMPTGGGKSLCYQLPALANQKLTLVISPLIALMKDQVRSLEARGIAATYINSSLTPAEIAARMQQVQDGRVRIVYVAPERFSNAAFQSLLQKLPIGLFAVDEAHCISQWGHDFRPDYRALREHIQLFNQRPTVAAFTATATPEVQKDIIAKLDLHTPHVYVRGFDRPNLKFFVRPGMKDTHRLSEVLRLVQSLDGSGIVYALTRKQTEEIATFLQRQGVQAAAYHAGLSSKERSRVQEAFMEHSFRIIVATIAFGMGVDKADIRFVIHAGMPRTLEGYYQEAGRAGRDGEQAYCILLAAGKDKSLHHFFIQQSRAEMLKQHIPHPEIRRRVDVQYEQLNSMLRYIEEDICRRKYILEYFNDPDAVRIQASCGGCDTCLGFSWEKTSALGAPASAPAKKITKNPSLLSQTVQETVRLYQEGKSLETIATIRSLAASTIEGHLLAWYIAGGDFNPSQLVSPEEERLILAAMARAENYQIISSIKDKLPPEISYEKIRTVIAKIHRIRL